MCTALHYKNGNSYFGRNMDIGYSFNEEVVIVPRNYPLTFKANPTNSNHFAMIGIAYVLNDYPLFADAINEKGLGIAGLNFPGYAVYNPEEVKGKHNITPYEIIPWILATCETVSQAKKLLENMNILAVPFIPQLELAPLHWMISDKEHSMVLESTADGIKLYDNPVGVMTNNPTFDWHLTNLSNYLNCSQRDLSPKTLLSHTVKPLGHGTGGLGLPGDTSTTSRFVKVAFAKAYAQCNCEEDASVSQFFHTLSTVAVPRGFALSADGVADYTTYMVCGNLNTGSYYYKTYDNHQLSVVQLHNEDLDGAKLKSFPMVLNQQVKHIN